MYIGFNPDNINTATQLALDSKVDKEPGYTLSKNDYTDEDKQKTMQLGEQSLELKSPNIFNLGEIAIQRITKLTTKTCW